MEQASKESPHPQFIPTLKIWLIVIMSLLLFLNICSGVAGFFLETYQNDVEKSTDEVERDIDALLSSMIDQETGLRGYITTADPAFLEPFHQGREVYQTTFPRLKQILRGENFKNIQKVFTRFDRAEEKWFVSFALIQIHLVQDKNYADVRSTRNARQGKALFDAFRHVTKQLKDLVTEDTLALRYNATALKEEVEITIVIITFLLLVMTWTTIKWNFHSLEKRFTVFLDTMAAYSQGDYHRRMPLMKYNEFQILALAFNEMVDIIERKQQEFQDNEQNFRLLIAALPQIVWTANPDGWLDYYNQKWFEYTGMTLEQTQGWGWEPILHPDDVQRCVEVWEHSFTTGESYEIEYRFKRASDGMYRWHLGRALPLRDADGTIIKWFGTATDIEDLKHSEEVLIRANQDQHNFVATVSHEFRTALTSIQGFSELLCQGDFEMEQVKDYANDIHADARRLNRMINDLLDLEKMQAGRAVLQLEELDFNTIVSEAVGRMNAITSEHEIEISNEKSSFIVSGDKDKLMQIIYNLLSNSIKYSPRGGYILIATSSEESQIHVCVRDQGIGIPQEALEKIFHPYNRVHAEGTRYIKGTGLGLPIVRHLIEMHGGRIWAESVPGQGSTFHFTLPVRQLALVID